MTCTINNNDNPPALHLRKTVTNDNGGTASTTDWTLTATGAAATPTNLSGTTPVDSGATFKADTYALAEINGPANYTAGAWSCGAATMPDATHVTVPLGGNVTCTINNNDNAPALHLRKTITNDNGGTASITDWTLTATGAAATPSNLSGTTPVDSGATFKADTYALAEINGPANYTAGAWSCPGATMPNATHVTVPLGGNVTCTINNNDNPPALHLRKTITNNDGGTAPNTAWTLTATGALAIPTNLSGSTPVDSGATFKADTYALAEINGPANYTAGAWNCGAATMPDATHVTVPIGGNVTCTINNDDNPPGLKVVKVLVPSTDIGRFDLRIDGSSPNAGSINVGDTGTTGFVPVMGGITHTASEIVDNLGGQGLTLADYVTTFSGACNSSGVTPIVVSGTNYTCTITNTRKATVRLLKTVSGLAPSGTQAFTFDIRTGATSLLDGTTVASGTGTANAANGGTVTFAAKLDPAGTYQFCESSIAVAWTTTLSALPGAFQPPNGGSNDTWCVPFGTGTSFTLTAGGQLTFTVNNAPPPGGGTRTIGYWKNWSSCDGKGNQAPSLDLNLPQLIGILPLAGGNPSPDCLKAISILNKSDWKTGKKMASDPAYNMAAQLLGAMLNVTAGAGTCANSTQAIASGQALLVAIGFNGTGSYQSKMTATQITVANTLAGILDAYNQDNSVCSSLPTPPSIVFNSNGTTISGTTGGTFNIIATSTPAAATTYSGTLTSAAPLAGSISVNSAGHLTVTAGTTPGTYTLKVTATSWGVVSETFTLIVN